MNCIFHEAPLSTPCQITSCDLWVESCKFCCGYVSYLTLLTTTEEEPSLPQIAAALGIDPDCFAKEVDQAYRELRKSRLTEIIRPKWSRVKNERRCSVCGGVATFTEGGWGYCSARCRSWAPPCVLNAEMSIGAALSDLFLKRRPKTRDIMAITGLDRTTAKNVLWQFAGIAPEENPKRWRKAHAPLIPNPSIPSAEELQNRISKSRLWK